MNADWSELETSLNQLGEALTEIISPLIQLMKGIEQSFNKSFRHIVWQRQADENLIDWGYRLEYLGLLDNPDYRWEYQKACLLTLISPVMWLGGKTKSLFNWLGETRD